MLAFFFFGGGGGGGGGGLACESNLNYRSITQRSYRRQILNIQILFG